MPQINRIRVNNVKYNFGTQYYDDFMMRFNCSNTIYDLANGGGKSLLMLLLLQNIIPNCTLDEKQPIEKLFRAGGGNTVIHSLIEWKLDSCYMKDNFKYMTTGFCARKARGEQENDESFLSENVSCDAAQSGAIRTNSSIEYFNYCIFYREFGDNDIKNLPLVSNGERITYNGLKAYLRELEKKDFGVSVKIFERKGDYQSFLSQYGIFESQWEIIRGINKTEGHVRTYFETNYRTSRKVVEDLLIEEIIQKSFNNRLGVDNDEGKMAQTLMDIKDKLVELSKKRAGINSYDSQMVVIDEFADYVSKFSDLYKRKQELEKQVYDLLTACKYEVIAQEKNSASLDNLIDKMNEEMESEQKNIQIAQIISEKNSLDAVMDLISINSKGLEGIDRQIKELSEKLTLMESVNDYKDYISYEKSFMEISEAINNRMKSHEDILSSLRTIADLIYDRNSVRINELEDKCNIAKQDVLKRENILKDAEEKLSEIIKKLTVDESFVKFTQAELENDEKQLAVLMEKSGLLVAENAYTQQLEIKEKLNNERTLLEKDQQYFEQISEKLTQCNADMSGLIIHNKLLGTELEKAAVTGRQASEDADKIQNLKKIYNAADLQDLAAVTLNLFKSMDRECEKAADEAGKLQTFIENAENGIYKFNSLERNKLKEYLAAHYGDDIEEGHEWFSKLNPGQRRDVLKRTPFIEYGFIVKGDFEKIKYDMALQQFGYGAYVVPLISEQILIDTKLEVNKELIAFAMNDLSFLRDEKSLNFKINVAKEELDMLNEKLLKDNDKKMVVWEDYMFTVRYMAVCDDTKLVDENKIRAQIEKNTDAYHKLSAIKEKCKLDVSELEKSIETRKETIAQYVRTEELIAMAVEKNSEISQKYDSLRAAKESEKQTELILQSCREEQQRAKQQLDASKSVLASVNESFVKLREELEVNYRQYHESDGIRLNENEKADYAALSDNELESKFFGLKQIIDKETVDVADKEALKEHYRISMAKCKRLIEYRGSLFSEVKEQYNSGMVTESKATQLLDIKYKLNELNKASKDRRGELDAQNALMNRLDGSIAHGMHQLEEKYGEVQLFKCENPENFISQHKELVKKLAANIKDVLLERQQQQKKLKDIYIIEKDLERIAKNAGLTVTDLEAVSLGDANGVGSTVPAFDGDLSSINIFGYEDVCEEYDIHLKRIDKTEDEFNKRRQLLIESLNSFGAGELAHEVGKSVEFPQNEEQTILLAQNLRETNKFIELEKQRISKGIEDMEQIKDNFENRCIQTCSNIKNELDRLHKLSTITMDDETISIISLSVPYIKEELYKERMSSYIDETVIMAESFKEPSERLKYIRNRLTWKRLFSVIVTDMNAVRIDLYKRERIKDQSRYLKYEEAVGSTGQSQGIYIQFLIAVINYISSINASSKDGAVLGKTIFIDNPFGAAKDIYIWEPIFKLLKTNHVQLIVPARGATPAITGRFDVNYILGQKLIDSRQQTVVVDYYSKTSQAQMEYTRMDYNQVTLDL